MIELPESNTLVKQINKNLVGKTVKSVIAAQSPHKFAWYHGDPNEYPAHLNGDSMTSAEAHGMFVQINLKKSTLLFSDGINLRLHPAAGLIPSKHQLLIQFDDGTALSASVQMYGGLFCFDKSVKFDNPYYQIAISKPSPLTNSFDQAYFKEILAPETIQKLSLKAALATEQRIPGLGNGVLQDILWHARLNPRRKVNTLSDEELASLFDSIKQTLSEMTHLGGRDTEKDLFGQFGGYQTVMSAKSAGKPCPVCGSNIVKEAYLGGSIYYCPSCQKVS